MQATEKSVSDDIVIPDRENIDKQNQSVFLGATLLALLGSGLAATGILPFPAETGPSPYSALSLMNFGLALMNTGVTFYNGYNAIHNYKEGLPTTPKIKALLVSSASACANMVGFMLSSTSTGFN